MAKNKKKFVKKGSIGYFDSEKKKRLLITIGLFILPLTVFFAGLAVNGTRNTVLTVIAVVGSLPGCRSIVNLIMVLRCKAVSGEVYDKILPHQGELVMAYESYMTFYEKNARIDAAAFCGNEVVLYSADKKVDTKFVAENTQKIIRKNGYKVEVHVLTDIKPFLERLDSMNKNRASLEEGIKFVPDEKYPELSRNELIKHTFLALCL